MHRAVVPPAQRHQVVEIGRAAVRRANDAVPVKFSNVTVTPVAALASVLEDNRLLDGSASPPTRWAWTKLASESRNSTCCARNSFECLTLSRRKRPSMNTVLKAGCWPISKVRMIPVVRPWVVSFHAPRCLRGADDHSLLTPRKLKLHPGSPDGVSRAPRYQRGAHYYSAKRDP